MVIQTIKGLTVHPPGYDDIRRPGHAEWQPELPELGDFARMSDSTIDVICDWLMRIFKFFSLQVSLRTSSSDPDTCMLGQVGFQLSSCIDFLA